MIKYYLHKFLIIIIKLNILESISEIKIEEFLKVLNLSFLD